MLSILIVFFNLMLPQVNHTASINFKGLDNDKGHLMIEIKNEKGQVVDQKIITIANKEANLKVELASGKYAIAVFHDVNNNKDLDTNAMGLPQEKYGFSNDARGLFGPPDLKDQLFSLSEDLEITINLK